MRRFITVLAALVLLVPGLSAEDESLSGHAVVSLGSLSAHVQSKNPDIDLFYLSRLYEHYRETCRLEGVNLTVALAQMIHETDYLRFTGSVNPIQYNYAGIGATGPSISGAVFRSMRAGVTAHVQHIKAYASKDRLVLPLEDPRFHLVERGSALSVLALTGRWATDPLYGEKIMAHIQALRAYDR